MHLQTVVLERSVCLHGGLGASLRESWQSDPVPCVPLAGQAAVGSAESFSVFSLNAAIRPVDEMPALKGTSYPQFWQHESSELQQEEIH